MWLFTPYGFYSVVCGSGMSGGAWQLAPDLLMIRGRSRGHLEALQKRFPELQAGDVMETPDTDYRYRLLVAKDVWADVVRQLAAEIDYGNFKSRAAIQSGDPRYVDALHEVWEVMERLQHP